MTENDDSYCITVCQGPPWCDLTGEAAEAAMKAGCQFCRRIFGDGEGGERIDQPGSC